MPIEKNTELLILFFIGLVLLNAPIVPMLQGLWLFGKLPALFVYCFVIWSLLIGWLFISQWRKQKHDEI